VPEPGSAGPSIAWEAAALGARPRLVSAARRILRDPADAEDAADEAIARLLGELRTGVRILDPEPWLYRTTLRLAIDRARRWALARGKLRDVAGRREPTFRDPHDAARSAEARDEVWRRILELPDRQQEIVILRDMEGLPFREVARLLGIAESSARSQGWAARETLRRKLERFVRKEENA